MTHWDTSVAIKQAINRALNATQGHKCNYQTSYQLSCKCHTGTQAQLSNKLLINLYQIQRYDFSLYDSTRTQLAIKQACNRSLPNTKVQSQPQCFNRDSITLHCNQSKVSMLTKVYFFNLDQNWVLNSVITSYALLYISEISNHNKHGMTELYISTYIEWLNCNT